ncbi:MAG TPA: VOC family protein [Pyrinomonadaceae bacterium]|jgi:predicted enzyme related to lactoylglutathione lyase
MPRVVHFEVSADDPDRASQFYKQVFGWHIEKWGGPKDYWLISTGADDRPGINGGIFKREGPVNYVNTIDVPSVDEFVAKITEHGGKEVVPRTTIPGVGDLVYCQDTEGNVFGILQPQGEMQ